jgi:biotin carboxyl carrier protein
LDEFNQHSGLQRAKGDPTLSDESNSGTCGPSTGALPERLPLLLEEMTRLLDANLAPKDFFAEFLGRLVAAANALGGAIWQRSAERSFHLAYSLSWEALGLEAIPDGRACHDQILVVAAQRDRPLWVPPNSGRKLVEEDRQAANLTDHGLLLAPVVVEKQVVGLAEIWLAPVSEGHIRRNLGRFLAEVAGFLAAYFHRQQFQELVEQRQLWTQLETFTRQIHSSLDLQVVAQWVANEGRRMLECDQLSVALRWGKTTEVAAISGANVVEKNSKLVRALQILCERVLAWGEKLIHQGKRDESLPPGVAHALDAYLTESNCTLLIVLPLEASEEGRAARPCAALVTESHEPSYTLEALDRRLETLARQAAPALGNALEVARMPLHGLSRGLARLCDWSSNRTLARLCLYAACAAIVIGILVFVQIPLRLEAKGQLVPVQRQMVYAMLHGNIVDLKARHGDRVDKGQELLFIEDLETQLQIDQLSIKTSAAEQRLALLSEQIGKSTNNEERNALTKEQINQEYELHKAMAERDILLQGSRSPRKAPVFAPLAGKVVTFDAQEQLLGKTVKPGDALLRVAAVKGTWEIELQIPERNLGPIREGLRGNTAGYVEVDVLLANQPHRTYMGRLYLNGLGGETTVKESNVVLPARVHIADVELVAQLEGLPVGLEVRTKVHCGPRPIGQVWFYELWEFFYEHVIF